MRSSRPVSGTTVHIFSVSLESVHGSASVLVGDE